MIEQLDISKKQVLVIDDSRMMLKIYQTQFKNSAHLKDYELSLCTDASEGYEWLNKYNTFHNELPKLIILDWIMPGKIDGFGLLNLIRKSETLRSIPILMVSSVEDKMKIVKAMKVGVNDYLMKPVNVGKLIDRVVKITDSQVV